MFRSTVLLALLISTPAMAFQARNSISVDGSESGFTVAASAGQAAPQSWCAAGDFVIRSLGLPATTPVYRISAAPRRSGESVAFSLSAEGAAEKSGLIELGDHDAVVSAGVAQSLCGAGRAGRF